MNWRKRQPVGFSDRFIRRVIVKWIQHVRNTCKFNKKAKRRIDLR